MIRITRGKKLAFSQSMLLILKQLLAGYDPLQMAGLLSPHCPSASAWWVPSCFLLGGCHLVFCLVGAILFSAWWVLSCFLLGGCHLVFCLVGAILFSAWWVLSCFLLGWCHLVFCLVGAILFAAEGSMLWRAQTLDQILTPYSPVMRPILAGFSSIFGLRFPHGNDAIHPGASKKRMLLWVSAQGARNKGLHCLQRITKHM